MAHHDRLASRLELTLWIAVAVELMCFLVDCLRSRWGLVTEQSLAIDKVNVHTVVQHNLSTDRAIFATLSAHQETH